MNSHEITFEYLKECAERAAGAMSFVDGVNTERWNNEFNKVQDYTFFRLACAYRFHNNGEKNDNNKWSLIHKQDEIRKDYERQMIK